MRTRPTLSPSIVLGSAKGGRLPAPLDNGQVTLYLKARNGLWQLIRALGIRESEVVLVPSYNCGAELDAVLRAPARARFYRIDEAAQFDLDELERSLEPEARAVIVTHYFGFPQPELAEVAELCRARGLFLIEDCAHALYSTRANRPLGTVGGAAVFSLWKSLPLPHGGAVLANEPLPLNGNTVAPPLAASLTALRVSMEGNMRLRYGTAGRAVTGVSWRLAALAERAARSVRGGNGNGALTGEPTLNPHVTFDRATAGWSMSPAARRIALRSPHAEIARRRRENYTLLAEKLDGIRGAHLLHPTLPDGTCPLALPLVVDDPESLLAQLARDRIGAELFWSDFHPQFPAADFPESAYLKTHVVTLPIHQDLDEALLERVAGAVRTWSLSP